MLIGCGGAVVLLLLIVVGCSAFMFGGDGPSDSPATDDADQEEGAGGEGGEEDAETVGVGDPGRVADWTVTVDGVEASPTYSDGVTEEEAQGVFEVVSLTVTNEGDESVTFDSSAVALRDADGKEYSSSTTLGSDALYLEQINPGNSASGEVVVDVPEDTEITEVVIEDVFSFDEPLVIELD
ncbi:DUF4352 domain-containing protein [Nocardiopsis baichengensis]|uniref:DUF4352 domain-containing protein n=1 Tax=Nocardiopsis baichengensis TaxID=280240 RepID=UPI000367E5D8|nr:DUF4352 domain-containing protein [Nocardiopsis baichengensis]